MLHDRGVYCGSRIRRVGFRRRADVDKIAGLSVSNCAYTRGTMAKLVLDLHDIFNKGSQIEGALDDIMRQAVDKKIALVEIIPGKGSGVLKERVLKYLQQKHVRAMYHRVEKDSKNFG